MRKSLMLATVLICVFSGSYAQTNKPTGPIYDNVNKERALDMYKKPQHQSSYASIEKESTPVSGKHKLSYSSSSGLQTLVPQKAGNSTAQYDIKKYSFPKS